MMERAEFPVHKNKTLYWLGMATSLSALWSSNQVRSKLQPVW
jgi:hypothetical protein